MRILWNDLRCQSLIFVIILGQFVMNVNGKSYYDNIDFDEGECAEEELRNYHALMDGCELYVAESTLDIDDLGTFSGVDVGEGVLIGESEIFISLADLMSGTFENLESEIWGDQLDDAVLGFDNLYGSREFVPGMGCLATGYSGLANAKYDYSNRENRPKSDSAGLHRFRDPGAGAFTNHYNIHFQTAQYILAGSEIFLDYGESWYADRAGSTKVPTTTKEEYDTANEIIRQALQDQVDQREWSLRLKHLYQSQHERISQILPRYVKDLEFADKVGMARYSHPHGSKGHIHSIPWLQNHGWCVSYLTSGRSTITQAGRGAFAKVRLPSNTVVAPAPMVIIDKRDMVMKELYENTFGEIIQDEDNVIGTQLLLNYCFGNDNSNVLLLPMTSVVNLINHSSTNPNVILRWTKVPGPHHDPSVLSMPEEEVFELNRVRIMMEFVAIRDIEPGEEILIDYGSDWSKAWDEHVTRWLSQRDPEDEEYISSRDFLEKFVPLGRPFPTKNQQSQQHRLQETSQETDIVPANLQFICHYQHEESHNVRRKNKKLRGNSNDNFIVREWNAEIRDLNWDCPMPCSLISYTATNDSNDNDNSAYYYSAEILDTEFVKAHEIPNRCILPQGRFVVQNIPSEFVTVVDLPYTSDQFIKGAFRHEMSLPTSLFPEAWLTH